LGAFTLQRLAEWLGRRLGKLRAVLIVDDEGVMIGTVPDRDVMPAPLRESVQVSNPITSTLEKVIIAIIVSLRLIFRPSKISSP
jgi:hypothetical protein